MDFEYYGTVDEANTYFGMRLYAEAWDNAEPADKPRALYAATTLIDRLNFKGDKSPVWALKQTLLHYVNPLDPFWTSEEVRITEQQLRDANAQQALEFPRGNDTEVPEDIRRACYEIAYSLLDGADPQAALENLQATIHGFGETRTSYERAQVPQEHIVNMIPSAVAYNLLKPYLRDERCVRTQRVS
jgi:hypothetical protein